MVKEEKDLQKERKYEGDREEYAGGKEKRKERKERQEREEGKR